MKCILYVPKEGNELGEYEIGESIRVGDYFPYNNIEYDVVNILLDANQQLPVVILEKK